MVMMAQFWHMSCLFRAANQRERWVNQLSSWHTYIHIYNMFVREQGWKWNREMREASHDMTWHYKSVDTVWTSLQHGREVEINKLHWASWSIEQVGREMMWFSEPGWSRVILSFWLSGRSPEIENYKWIACQLDTCQNTIAHICLIVPTTSWISLRGYGYSSFADRGTRRWRVQTAMGAWAY
jgi:hypothetical protein